LDQGACNFDNSMWCPVSWPPCFIANPMPVSARDHWYNSNDSRDDKETLLPSQRQMLGEPIHAMEVPDAPDEALAHRRSFKRTKYRETPEEKKIKKMLERQQQAQGMAATQQESKKMDTAKQQILDSNSLAEFLEKVEILIEDHWLGNLDSLPGSIYYVATFGGLTQKKLHLRLGWCESLCSFIGLLGDHRHPRCERTKCVLEHIHYMGNAGWRDVPVGTVGPTKSQEQCL